MKRAALIIAPAAVLGLSLAGCSSSQASPPADQPAPASSAAPVTPPPAVAPPAPQPAVTASCPYLTKTFVQDANGQHVGAVKVSSGGGQAHPSCFFYRPDGGQQLSVRVYVGDAATATAIVNAAAPLATSNPATEPAGWQGGSLSAKAGAVYAVAKGGDAVVVSTNQEQTIKARVVAVQAISALGF